MLTSSIAFKDRAGDLALVIGEWSFNGIGTDGKPVNLASTSTDVMHQHSDGTWRVIIDNPWGTN